MEPEELAGAITRLVAWAERQTPRPESPLQRRLREHFGVDPVDHAILFELLNAMDGLDEDHDVLFVLTTNRADLLEPALAARPGRVDEAVELPLPDAAARQRLLELYGHSLQLTFEDGDDGLVADLEGTSPAFIRELLRRSALLAAEETPHGALRVTQRHLHDAIRDLRRGGNELTQALLGARPQTSLDD